MIDKEKKKFFIEQLLSINNMLDTYRTNLNILIYNIYENDRLTTLPAVDFDEMKKNCIAFANLLNGAVKNYSTIRANENIEAAAKVFNKNKNASAKNIIDPTDKLKKQDAKEFKERNEK